MRFNRWLKNRYADKVTITPTEVDASLYLKDQGIDTIMIRPSIVAKLATKSVVWDFCGVMHPYEANFDRTVMDEDDYVKYTLTQRQIFRREPSKVVQTLIESILDPEEQFVITAVATSQIYDDTKRYLKEHYPSINDDHIYGVAKSEYKIMIMQRLFPIPPYTATRTNPNRHDVIIIDDLHSTLKNAEETGYCAMHASFLIP